MLTRSLGPVVILLGAFLFVATSAFAQPTIIRGVVVDIGNEPIAGVLVTTVGGPFNRTATVESDDSGRFELVTIRGGQWVFSASRSGYQELQMVGNVRSARVNLIELRMKPDPLSPPAPSRGHLAGIRADDLQAEIDTAHALFDQGDYDGAIAAYQSTLERIPVLTALNLQIGHAYREKQDYENARTAYEAVPPESRAAAEAAVALQGLDATASSR